MLKTTPNYLIALIALIAIPFSSFSAESSKQPNILLIVADDLGWKDLGYLGSDYYETPHLDRFAGQSMRFTQAYAGAANCAPSRACLMSGLNTPRHGVYTVLGSDRGKASTRKIIPTPNTIDLAPEFKTLGAAFQDLGYETITIGKWHLGPDPLQQGFDQNVAGNRSGSPQGGYFAPYKNPNLKSGPDGEYLTDRLTQEALDLLDAHDSEKPFFLYFPHYAVHTPLQAPEDLIQKYKDKGPRNGQGNSKYAGMVDNFDANLGRIFDYLKAKDLEKDTIVVFTSDNGGIRSVSTQAPLRAGKGSYYEGGIRVPLAIRWPGKIKAGTSTKMPTTNLDLYPTLLDLVGADFDASKLDGKSIAPQLLKRKALAERPLIWHFPIYLQAYKPKDDDGRDPLFRTRPGSVIRRGKWKLHEYFEDGTLELYNLENDLGERQNLAEKRPEIAQRLHKELTAWRKQVNAPVPTAPNPEYDAAAEKLLTEKALAK